MKSNTARQDAGLLILRIGLASVFLLHGTAKMFPVLGGRGYVETVNGFIASGIPPVFAHLAIVAEFFGGLGVLIGFMTPLAAFGLASTMAVASYRMLPKGPILISDANAYLFPIFLFLASVALMILGPGKYSVDARYFRRSSR